METFDLQPAGLGTISRLRWFLSVILQLISGFLQNGNRFIAQANRQEELSPVPGVTRSVLVKPTQPGLRNACDYET